MSWPGNTSNIAKQFIESRSDDWAYLDKWDLSSSYGRVIAQAAHSTIGINFDVGEDVYLDEITGWLETELQGLAGKDLIDFLSIEDSGIAEGSCRDFSGGDPPRYMPRDYVALGAINHPQLFVAISKYENFLLSYPDSPARHSVLEKLEFLYPLLSKGSSKSPIFNLSHSDLSTLHGYEFNERVGRSFTTSSQRTKSLRILQKTYRLLFKQGGSSLAWACIYQKITRKLGK